MSLSSSVCSAGEHADEDLMTTFKLFGTCTSVRCVMCDKRLTNNDSVVAFVSLDVATDTNGNGFIEHSELKAAMKTFYGAELSDADITDMIKAADDNGDQKLSFEEFKKVMAGKK